MESPVSLPNPTSPKLAAIAAAVPPLEPAVARSRAYGFFVYPGRIELTVSTGLKAHSAMFDCAGEIEHGRVGFQPGRNREFDPAWIHEKSVCSRSGDGRFERRHGGGDCGELRAGRVRKRYRRFHPRAVVASG